MPEVIQSSTAYLAAFHHFQLVDDRGVYRKYAFNSVPKRNLPNCESRRYLVAFDDHYHALEHLDAVFVTLLDLHMDANRISRAKLREIRSKLRTLDRLH